jgi:hypothetical protein
MSAIPGGNWKLAICGNVFDHFDIRMLKWSKTGLGVNVRQDDTLTAGRLN